MLPMQKVKLLQHKLHLNKGIEITADLHHLYNLFKELNYKFNENLHDAIYHLCKQTIPLKILDLIINVEQDLHLSEVLRTNDRDH
jgi:hypothetical protein